MPGKILQQFAVKSFFQGFHPSFLGSADLPISRICLCAYRKNRNTL